MPLIRRFSVLAALLAVAAAWSGSALAAGEPANTTLPTIDGRPQVGQTMTSNMGVWTGSPTSYAYQWQRCAAASSCTDIVGATADTYVIGLADAGYALDLVVTATNVSGDGTATSARSYFVTTFSLATTHFVVHYQSNPDTDAAIAETQAGDVGAFAERAYAAELADGYPAPPSDGAGGGDARIDIYVGNISEPGVLGYAVPLAPGAPTAGYILLNAAPALDGEGLAQHTVAHELFHLIQFGIWLPSTVTDNWLLEGSAEWMGFKVDGFTADSFELGNWDMALDCRDAFGTFQCDLEDAYKNDGYSRWPFFEYVAERWGADFTKGVFTQGAAGGVNATTALSNAIAGKGSSLGDVFTDWTVANMTGGYAVKSLQDILPPAYGAAVSTGTLASLNAKTKQGAPPLTSGSIAPVQVGVNHLSARYVAIKHGDATLPDGPCYKATLDLSVALPAGVGARPYFWWSQKNPDSTKQPAQPFSISGTTASISLPWDTCDWGSSQGYVSLPNPTTSLDAQDFTISGTLTIDRGTEATATPPPDPVFTTGTAIDATGTGDVPRIEVFGPQLIHLSAASRYLRLIVSSSDSGALQAALGSRALGSAKLRAGSNDVRFVLPAAAVRALRSTSAVANALTLTPLSASGTAGKSLVRRVALQRTAVKPKAKAKAKAKPKAKLRKKA